MGRGYSAKGLIGIGQGHQQITLEVNNNYSKVQDKYLGKVVDANYISWPIYAGYRRYFKKFFIEGQFGVAINTISAFRTDSVTASAQESKKYLAWALGGGYKLKYFELGARYQLSPIANSSDINFMALRLAYRLPFFRKKQLIQ